MKNRKTLKGPPSKPKALPDFPLPNPMELAKLAAILETKHALLNPRAGGDHLRGMRQAMESYIEAVLFVHELPRDAEAILNNYASVQRQAARMQEASEILSRQLQEAIRADVVILDPNEKDDEARRYLDAIAQRAGLTKGGSYMKPGSLLKNLRRFASSTEPPITEYKRKENGRTKYRVPRYLLDALVEDKYNARRASRLKGAKTKRLRRANPSSKAKKLVK